MTIKRTPVEQRFWAKVKKGDVCWMWQGAKGKGGYGRFNVEGHLMLPHRISYEWTYGPIPGGMQIDHLCRNRACVNPDHMEVVTPKENTLRGQNPCAKNARKTHCPHGHPYSGENLYIAPNGDRACKSCKRAVNQRWRRRAAAFRADVMAGAA